MYSFRSRVRYSETDEHSYLKAKKVLDYFQDCSTFEGEDIGIGLGYMAERNLVWVLSSWQVVFDEYPKMGDEIIIYTMPYELKGCFGFRNYKMTTPDGKILAYANAMWSLLSTKTHKPERATKEMIASYELSDRLEMDYAPRKIEIPESGEIREKIEVKSGYIDSNNHVNNGSYVSIAFETLIDGDVVSKEKVGQIRAQYKKEAHLGDILYPRVVNGENVVVVSLEDAEGKPYAIVELKGKQ